MVVNDCVSLSLSLSLPRWLMLAHVVPSLHQVGTKLAPTWPQVGPKSAHVGPSCPKLAQVRPKLAHVGPNWPQVGPSWPQVGPKLAPSWPQVGPKRPLKAVFFDDFRAWAPNLKNRKIRVPVEAKRSFFGSRRAHVGPKLVPRWPMLAHVGPSWPQVGPKLARIG